MLSAIDEAYLRNKGYDFEVTVDQGMICVVIKNYPLPAGYEPTSTDLMLRLPGGFPDAQPDMFWCDPPVKSTATDAYPPAADLMESYLGHTWQRFSRHLAAGVWKPGHDSLASYLALIRNDLERATQVKQ